MTMQNRTETGNRRRVRRELLRQYMHLQREMTDADPSSTTYVATMHSFRQIGYALISSGFEDDLDRLLRIRILDGGRAERHTPDTRSIPQDFHIIEPVPAR